MKREKRRTSFELFRLGTSIKGNPKQLKRATFASLKARELDDIERWVKAEPSILGEDLLVITSQLTGFEGTRDGPESSKSSRQAGCRCGS